MMRTCFLLCCFVMVFSFAAAARDKQPSPRQQIELHLRQGRVDDAMEAANALRVGDRESPPHSSQMNIILHEHARYDSQRVEEVFSVPVSATIRELCVQHATDNNDDPVAKHNLGYILLQGVGGMQDVPRAIALLKSSQAQNLHRRFVLIDSTIFDEKGPPLQELARSLFEKVDWDKHPLLQKWICQHMGMLLPATVRHPTRGLLCLEKGSPFKRL